MRSGTESLLLILILSDDGYEAKRQDGKDGGIFHHDFPLSDLSSKGG
jgi:hypothetical protein